MPHANEALQSGRAAGILANTVLEEAWETPGRGLGGGHRMKPRGNGFSCKYKGVLGLEAVSVPTGGFATGEGILVRKMLHLCILVAFYAP